MKKWTFGKKLGWGLGALCACVVLMAVISTLNTNSVLGAQSRVMKDMRSQVVGACNLDTSIEARVAAIRAALLTRDESYSSQFEDNIELFGSRLDELVAGARDDAQRARLREIGRASQVHCQVAAKVLGMARDNSELETILGYFEGEVVPRFVELRDRLEDFRAAELARNEAALEAATEQASFGSAMIIGTGAMVLLVAIVIAVLLIRSLDSQVGGAVSHMRTSSSDLQTSATQQATSVKEQLTAVRETLTTTKELVTSATQIGACARRVVDVAQEARGDMQNGEQTVDDGMGSMRVVKEQVDRVVSQMIDLGRKSQRIGGVVEVINELSEQTNILAVNATIEAAGAGDAGVRFAAVSDEIRNLAERVGSSTREIRNLVDEVRAAVNSTVMATEAGAKAVDEGVGRFELISAAFTRLAGSVNTTADAAGEIRIATEEQLTAIQQVNTAVNDVFQAASETDATVAETLETASRLNSASGSLLRLVTAAR